VILRDPTKVISKWLPLVEVLSVPLGLNIRAYVTSPWRGSE